MSKKHKKNKDWIPQTYEEKLAFIEQNTPVDDIACWGDGAEDRVQDTITSIFNEQVLGNNTSSVTEDVEDRFEGDTVTAIRVENHETAPETPEKTLHMQIGNDVPDVVDDKYAGVPIISAKYNSVMDTFMITDGYNAVSVNIGAMVGSKYNIHKDCESDDVYKTIINCVETFLPVALIKKAQFDNICATISGLHNSWCLLADWNGFYMPDTYVAYALANDFNENVTAVIDRLEGAGCNVLFMKTLNDACWRNFHGSYDEIAKCMSSANGKDISDNFATIIEKYAGHLGISDILNLLNITLDPDGEGDPEARDNLLCCIEDGCGMYTAPGVYNQPTDETSFKKMQEAFSEVTDDNDEEDDDSDETDDDEDDSEEDDSDDDDEEDSSESEDDELNQELDKIAESNSGTSSEINEYMDLSFKSELVDEPVPPAENKAEEPKPQVATTTDTNSETGGFGIRREDGHLYMPKP